MDVGSMGWARRRVIVALVAGLVVVLGGCQTSNNGQSASEAVTPAAVAGAATRAPVVLGVQATPAAQSGPAATNSGAAANTTSSSGTGATTGAGATSGNGGVAGAGTIGGGAATTAMGSFATAVRDVSERVRPAVVQITNEQVQLDQFNQPFTVPAGVGSGVLYDGQGHILTNNHVVEGAQNLLG